MRRKRIHKGYKYVYICVDVVRKNIFNILSLIWYYYWHASETSLKMISEGGETGRSISYLASSMQNAFSFKLQDRKGRLHRFTCGMLTITCFQSCLYVHVCFHSQVSSISFSMQKCQWWLQYMLISHAFSLLMSKFAFIIVVFSNVSCTYCTSHNSNRGLCLINTEMNKRETEKEKWMGDETWETSVVQHWYAKTYTWVFVLMK